MILFLGSKPYLSNNSIADLPSFALCIKFSLEEKVPSSLANITFLALTVPKPGIADSGGLIPSSSTKNLIASDLYKSIGKNSIFRSDVFVNMTIFDK